MALTNVLGVQWWNSCRSAALEQFESTSVCMSTCMWDFSPLTEDSSSLKALRMKSELKWMHGRASLMSCEKSSVLRERRNCFRELLGPE